MFLSFMFYIFTCKVLKEIILFTWLLIGTLGIIFFAIFFREPPRIVKVFFILFLGVIRFLEFYAFNKK